MRVWFSRHPRCDDLAECARVAGDEICPQIVDAEIAVFFGARSHRDAGTPKGAVIADKGYLTRRHTVFGVDHDGTGRWGGTIEHWIANPEPPTVELPETIGPKAHGYTLILGQDPQDFASIEAGYDPSRIKGRLRPHPRVERSERSLEDDLAGARQVIGWNTSALVEAAVRGLPVKTLSDHSMACGPVEFLASLEWPRDAFAAAWRAIRAKNQ